MEARLGRSIQQRGLRPTLEGGAHAVLEGALAEDDFLEVGQVYGSAPTKKETPNDEGAAGETDRSAAHFADQQLFEPRQVLQDEVAGKIAEAVGSDVDNSQRGAICNGK